MANASKRTRLSETRQVAALPWRVENGQRRILMITSRETRRWVIPKGGRMVGKSDPEAAAQEALEEAGVKGEIEARSIGVFRYAKGLKDGGLRRCVVSVYPLQVLIQLGAWPEAHQRERRWMTPREAAEAVQEPDLAALIRDFDATPVDV
ncbi:NUDIX hydrolase [Brevundimonas sp. SORGH_AS_0993]|uniref:NUDIX hydrolase n=1 Tax=Brevundimonas sp. SORGH_AS_0993 TaxID=3041794 RepID=UPI00278A4A9B|nr:NUDIX hydrolase [Brevundimonas sp. SORGH_AS_0993]MDQ1153931.1 8-oxo-dGTP pyrophosphatase MutT (NUDIX family) [Brevundimonas sp. SORGH_AS_0993]